MKPALRAIVSTARGDRGQLGDLAVEGFLNKPYGADTLLRALHTARPNVCVERASTW